MRKLNNRGYLTVEIVIASVLAFTVAFFLMDLTIRIVNDTESAYYDTILMTDRALIVKNLRNYIEIDKSNHGGSISEIRYEHDDPTTNIIVIKYADGNSGCLSVAGGIVDYYDCGSTHYYQKKLNDKFGNSTISEFYLGDYVYFKIAGDTNIFTGKNYDISIFVSK